MIILIEFDARPIDPSDRYYCPWWRPGLYKGFWDGGKCWRVWWWFIAISCYPSPGIMEFFEHVPKTGWFRRSRR